jgi:hypothetical protein
MVETSKGLKSKNIRKLERCNRVNHKKKSLKKESLPSKAVAFALLIAFSLLFPPHTNIVAKPPPSVSSPDCIPWLGSNFETAGTAGLLGFPFLFLAP